MQQNSPNNNVENPEHFLEEDIFSDCIPEKEHSLSLDSDAEYDTVDDVSIDLPCLFVKNNELTISDRRVSEYSFPNCSKDVKGAYFIKPSKSGSYLVYLENNQLRFLCPWCGRAHTTPLSRQLHLFLFPRSNFSCNETSQAMVSCTVCNYSTKGYNFALHPCTFIFLNALEKMSLSDTASIEPADLCILCGTSHGCKYGLISHLLVHHLPNAEPNQCGYCGISNTDLKVHEAIHKEKIGEVANEQLASVLEKTRIAQSYNWQTLKVLNCLRKCLPCSSVEKRKTAAEIFLGFISPLTCSLCGCSKKSSRDLQSHIIHDFHEQLNDRKLYFYHHDERRLFHCQLCENANTSDQPCLGRSSQLEAKPRQGAKFTFSARRTCLLCWNRNLRIHQLMVHIPVRHNLSRPGVCGICHQEVEPGHERKHENELKNRVGANRNKIGSIHPLLNN